MPYATVLDLRSVRAMPVLNGGESEKLMKGERVGTDNGDGGSFYGGVVATSSYKIIAQRMTRHHARYTTHRCKNGRHQRGHRKHNVLNSLFGANWAGSRSFATNLAVRLDDKASSFGQNVLESMRSSSNQAPFYRLSFYYLIPCKVALRLAAPRNSQQEPRKDAAVHARFCACQDDRQLINQNAEEVNVLDELPSRSARLVASDRPCNTFYFSSVV
jgi:hypothetical protein